MPAEVVSKLAERPWRIPEVTMRVLKLSLLQAAILTGHGVLMGLNGFIVWPKKKGDVCFA